jgi:hypothetical protein
MRGGCLAAVIAVASIIERFVRAHPGAFFG